MKILVTGGAGFIGSNFIRYILSETGWTITNLDKLTYAGNLENLAGVQDDPRYSFVRGDIAEATFINSLFTEKKFDTVVNFAAESHVDRSIMDASPFIQANIAGAQALLDAARKYGLQKFVQVSTDEVYGSLEHPWPRTAPIPPARRQPTCSAGPISRPTACPWWSPAAPTTSAPTSSRKS